MKFIFHFFSGKIAWRRAHKEGLNGGSDTPGLIGLNVMVSMKAKFVAGENLFQDFTLVYERAFVAAQHKESERN